MEVFNYITLSSFRPPIKSFIDEKFNKINKTIINSDIPHEDYILHQDFKLLVEILLSVIKEDLKISYADFIENLKQVGKKKEKEELSH